MRRGNSFLFPNMACSCLALFNNGAINCIGCYSNGFCSLFNGWEGLNKLARKGKHLYRVGMISAISFCKSLSCIFIRIVVLAATPFKVIHPVIRSYFVDMINKWEVFRIWDKSLCYKAVNMTIMGFAILCQSYSTIAILANRTFKDTSLEVSYIRLFETLGVANKGVGKSFNPSEIGDLKKSLKAFHLFPNLFHNTTM